MTKRVNRGGNELCNEICYAGVTSFISYDLHSQYLITIALPPI